MATWDFSAGEDKTCTRCGSIFEVKYHQIPQKDIDSYDCEVCGLELDNWKTTRYPIYKLKVRAKWPNTPATF